MRALVLRRGLVSAVALCLAACGAGDRSQPAAPSAVQAARTPDVAAPAVGMAMPAESSGTKPPGFDMALRLEPKPGLDGVILGDSPLTVQIDVCHSAPGEGQSLTYLFDWDFDSLADVVATGDDCVQKHKFSVPAGASRAERSLKANVCVVSGNPNLHGPNTYFSCRTIRLELVPPPEGPACHDLCEQGPLLLPECGECAALICEEDDFCCEDFWDGICVGEVDSICGLDICGDQKQATSSSRRRR